MSSSDEEKSSSYKIQNTVERPEPIAIHQSAMPQDVPNANQKNFSDEWWLDYIKRNYISLNDFKSL